jgi:hypothetical protein
VRAGRGVERIGGWPAKSSQQCGAGDNHPEAPTQLAPDQQRTSSDKAHD